MVELIEVGRKGAYVPDPPPPPESTDEEIVTDAALALRTVGFPKSQAERLARTTGAAGRFGSVPDLIVACLRRPK